MGEKGKKMGSDNQSFSLPIRGKKPIRRGGRGREKKKRKLV